jgi:hypothetical protein
MEVRANGYANDSSSPTIPQSKFSLDFHRKHEPFASREIRDSLRAEHPSRGSSRDGWQQMSGLAVRRTSSLTRDYRARNRRFAAGFENWLRARNYPPSTQYARTRAIGKWLDFLGPDDLTAITHSRIRLFMAEANKDSEQRRRLDALRAFYRFLLLAGRRSLFPG